MQNNISMEVVSNDVSSNTFNTTLSLYIPAIKEEITKEELINYFIQKNIGVVTRVDFVFNNKGIRQAFIHFSLWFKNDYTIKLQEQVLNPKLVALIKNNDLSTNSIKNDNIILLPNYNPKSKPDVNIITTLQERIVNLESKMAKMIEISNDEREAYSPNYRKRRLN